MTRCPTLSEALTLTCILALLMAIAFASSGAGEVSVVASVFIATVALLLSAVCR